MVTTIEIAGHTVGAGAPCFIVAEAGVNHNGSLDTACRLVDAAVAAQADAVKFQSFTAERLAIPAAPKARYQLDTTDAGESQLQMLKRLELSPEAHRVLRDYCRTRNITFLSTPFDEDRADLLETLGVAAFKISSGELTNTPLLAHVARKGKPLLVSTGMASLTEVRIALQTIYAAGNRAVVLLHCVSNYPAAPQDANLRAMQTMARELSVPVGYSDHTLGIEVALAAAALGACVIEKHLTLDRALPGPDHRASLEPEEFMRLVRGIRAVEASLGHGQKAPTASEQATAAVARKSLVAACDIPRGTPLTEELIAIKRPGTGLPPTALDRVIGRVAAHDIPVNTLLTWEMVA